MLKIKEAAISALKRFLPNKTQERRKTAIKITETSMKEGAFTFP